MTVDISQNGFLRRIWGSSAKHVYLRGLFGKPFFETISKESHQALKQSVVLLIDMDSCYYFGDGLLKRTQPVIKISQVSLTALFLQPLQRSSSFAYA